MKPFVPLCLAAVLLLGWGAAPAAAQDELAGPVLVARSGLRPAVFVRGTEGLVRVRPWQRARTLIQFEGLHVRLWGRGHRVGNARWFWALTRVSPVRATLEAAAVRSEDGSLALIPEGDGLAAEYTVSGPGASVLEQVARRRGAAAEQRVEVDAWFFPDSPHPGRLYVEAVAVRVRPTAGRGASVLWRAAPDPDAAWGAFPGAGQQVWAREVRAGHYRVRYADASGWVRAEDVSVGRVVAAAAQGARPARSESGGLIGGLGR